MSCCLGVPFFSATPHHVDFEMRSLTDSAAIVWKNPWNSMEVITGKSSIIVTLFFWRANTILTQETNPNHPNNP